MSGRASTGNGTRVRSTRKTRSYRRSLSPPLPPSAKLARRAVVHEIALRVYENQRNDFGRVMYGAMKVVIDEARHLYPWLARYQVNRQLRHIKKGKENDIVAIRQRKEKQKCLFLCCLLTLFFYRNPQGDRQAKKFI